MSTLAFLDHAFFGHSARSLVGAVQQQMAPKNAGISVLATVRRPLEHALGRSGSALPYSKKTVAGIRQGTRYFVPGSLATARGSLTCQAAGTDAARRRSAADSTLLPHSLAWVHVRSSSLKFSLTGVACVISRLGLCSCNSGAKSCQLCDCALVSKRTCMNRCCTTLKHQSSLSSKVDCLHLFLGFRALCR